MRVISSLPAARKIDAIHPENRLKIEASQASVRTTIELSTFSFDTFGGTLRAVDAREPNQHNQVFQETVSQASSFLDNLFFQTEF